MQIIICIFWNIANTLNRIYYNNKCIKSIFNIISPVTFMLKTLYKLKSNIFFKIYLIMKYKFIFEMLVFITFYIYIYKKIYKVFRVQ